MYKFRWSVYDVFMNKSNLTIRAWLQLGTVRTGPFRSAREAAKFRQVTPGFAGSSIVLTRTGR